MARAADMIRAGRSGIGLYRTPLAGPGVASPGQEARGVQVTLIPSWRIEPGEALALMRSAAVADQPGSTGMDARYAQDNEWMLVSACIHEAAHSVVADRYESTSSKITLGRDDQLGQGTCVSLLPAHTASAHRRQYGMAGLVGELWARYGSYLNLDVAVEAFRRGPISAKDLALMEGTAAPAEIDVCMRRVHLQWADVTALAKRLLATELRHYCGVAN